jgi:hypothetical protein
MDPEVRQVIWVAIALYPARTWTPIMVFVIIMASLLGDKPSFPFDNCQQGGMGQNFNTSEPSLKDIVWDQLGWTQSEIKKVSPTDLVEEEEKAEAEVEAEPRSEKEEENLGKASPKDISDIHLLPCSATILVDLPNKMGDPGVPTIFF